jgi:hypothetical protein
MLLHLLQRRIAAGADQTGRDVAELWRGESYPWVV